MTRTRILLSTAFSLLLLAAAVVAAQGAVQRSTGQVESAVERSTGQVEISYEPVMPKQTTRVELPAGKASTVLEGTASATAPALFTFAPPAGRMLEIRVASPSGQIFLSIFRDEESEPERGSTYESRSLGWISSSADGSDLRILVWTRETEARPFKLLVRVHAADD